MEPNSVPSVEIDQLPPDATVLDVREDNEWQAGHAPQAVHIPMAEVPNRLGELPEGEQLYVVCRSGGRSARVTAYLNGSGWEAVNVAGGMQAWHSAGRDMVAELGTEPAVL